MVLEDRVEIMWVAGGCVGQGLKVKGRQCCLYSRMVGSLDIPSLWWKMGSHTVIEKRVCVRAIVCLHFFAGEC